MILIFFRDDPSYTLWPLPNKKCITCEKKFFFFGEKKKNGFWMELRANGIPLGEFFSAKVDSLMDFEDFEREVRTVLDGMLGPAGFSAADDILAITVNRWPHGYSYDYLDLWDPPEWPPGEAPHEIARKPFGSITFANSDAGAEAYLHVAIDEAWRAIDELQM